MIHKNISIKFEVTDVHQVTYGVRKELRMFHVFPWTRDLTLAVVQLS